MAGEGWEVDRGAAGEVTHSRSGAVRRRIFRVRIVRGGIGFMASGYRRGGSRGRSNGGGDSAGGGRDGIVAPLAG